MPDEHYISWSEYTGAWYFKDASHTPTSREQNPYRDVTDDDLSTIRPLTAVYSQQLWGTFVSNKTRHLMEIHKDDDDPPYTNYRWMMKIDYARYLELKNGLETFADELTRYVPYKSDDPIYFFWSRNHAVETVWHVFVRYWPNFTLEDEADILIAPE